MVDVGSARTSDSAAGASPREVLEPGQPGYDEARRVFNGMVDRSPAMIVRCSDTADVVAAIELARERRLPLSVYGGGHGVTGSAVIDGGLCIDLRGMKTAVVDPDARTLVADGGLTWGEIDAATQEHGLAVTGGRMTTTGIGGLALGSGSGWLERKLGYTCDSLLKAEVVTADGKVVTASADENSDLFWGLRGGGGNFGVVTRFTMRLHPVGPLLLAGMLLYPGEMARDVLRNWRDFMAGAPDEVGGAVAFMTAPPADFVPEPARGKPMVGVMCTYAGPVEDGQQVLEPLMSFGPPVVTMVQPMPYVAVQQMIDAGNPTGMRNYWSADFFAELPDEAVDTLVTIASQPQSPLSQVVVFPGGGAVSRVPEDESAFGERHAPWNIHYLSIWLDPADDDTNIAHTRSLAQAMKPWTSGRAYLNFIGDEGTDRVAAAFGPEKYARLRALKKVWDPDNLFRHNQNIPPAE
jgi:FAD/FMN-containing dehydrogenase